MGQLKLFLGHSGPYYYFEKLILEQYKAAPDQYIYILPVNRAVRYFKKQLILKSTSDAMLDPPVFTFSSLIRRLYHYETNKKKIVSNAIRLILLKEALKNCKDDLSYFKNQRLTDKGLIKRIDRMLLEFSQFGYRPSDFINPPSPSIVPLYFDFSKILQALYQNYQNQLTDESSLVLEIVRDLDEVWFRNVFPSTKTILINGYGIYSPPMIDFIKKMKQWCDLQIKLDYLPANKQLFQHTYAAYDSLRKYADQIIETSDKPDWIAQQLFKMDFISAGKMRSKKKIMIRKARNRREEISFIAAAIKQYYHKYNIPLHKIGVTFPNVETYFSIISTIFKQYDIPFNLSTGFPLAQSPLVKTYLQVIKTILSDFNLEDMNQLVISPFLKCKNPIDTLIFSRITNRLGLRSFHSDWQNGIEKFITCDVESHGYQNGLTDKSFIKKVKELVKGIKSLITILFLLKNRFSARDFHTAYLSVLKELGLLDWYSVENDQLNNQEKEKEFRAFNKFNKIFDQLCWILTFIYPERRFTLNEFYDYMILMIDNTQYNLREWSNYGVQIMPRLEIQSVECNILFLGGLVDGEFPRKGVQNVFFNDEECKLMGIYSSEDIHAQDRFLFYQLLQIPSDELILTYPSIEGESLLLPSTFLSILSDIYEVTFQSIDEQDPYLLSKYKIKEQLAQQLKMGLVDRNIQLLADVMSLTGHGEFTIWFDNITTLYSKKNRSRITPYEGNLTANPFIQRLLGSKLADKYFSITELESYAFCPMLFFFKYILHLHEEIEMEEQISPLERGLLLHKILFTFYSRLQQRGFQSRPWEYMDWLIEIAEEEFDRLPYQGLSWILEKEEYFGFEKKEGLFKSFLTLEKEEIEDKGFIPAHFEVSFGISRATHKCDKISFRKPFILKKGGQKEIRLSGKVDRIDLDGRGNFIVYDYKIGRGAEQIKMRHIFEGSSLQLPVYLAAASEILKEHYQKISPLGGAYYQIKDSKHCAKFPVIMDGKKVTERAKRGDAYLPNKKYVLNEKQLSFEEIVKRSLDFVAQYVQQIVSGNFQHTHDPTDMRCSSYCEFAMICRKDIAKLKAIHSR
jgi:ATP-dependent helicase/nuclease subunit B